jgi:hypothetical protein
VGAGQSAHGTMTSEHSHLEKVHMLKLLLAMKFNLHLFILMYSDEYFISMRFPCTCISMAIVNLLSLDSFTKNPFYPQYPLFLSYCLFAHGQNEHQTQNLACALVSPACIFFIP